MAKKKIIIEPDPILRKKSINLEKVDKEVKKLMDDMLETMYSAPGIGLAAVQIGILKRVIVIDISKEQTKKNPLFLINSSLILKKLYFLIDSIFFNLLSCSKPIAAFISVGLKLKPELIKIQFLSIFLYFPDIFFLLLRSRDQP